jgi:oxygen-independent coproporphyrinogen-3 oxidase
MYLAAIERVTRRGFEHYEISNFARPGHRCLHNLAYWNHEPYVGIGPSAVGCVDGLRYRNVPDGARYVQMIDQQGHAEIETERIDGDRLASEMAMLRLRLIEGIDVADFERRTAMNPNDVFAAPISRYRDLGMLATTRTHIALSDRGRLYADDIIADLMAELDDAESEPRP